MKIRNNARDGPRFSPKATDELSNQYAIAKKEQRMRTLDIFTVAGLAATLSACAAESEQAKTDQTTLDGENSDRANHSGKPVDMTVALSSRDIQDDLERLKVAGWRFDFDSAVDVDGSSPGGQRIISFSAKKRAGAPEDAATIDLVEVQPSVWALGFHTSSRNAASMLDQDLGTSRGAQPEDSASMTDGPTVEVNAFQTASCTVAPITTSCHSGAIRSNGNGHYINYVIGSSPVRGTDWQVKDHDNGVIVRQGHLGVNSADTSGRIPGLFGAYFVFVFNTTFDAFGGIDNR